MKILAWMTALLGFSLGTASALGASAPPRVEFELITEAGFPITGAQRWMAMLKDVDLASVRIRGARPGERVRVDKRGAAGAPTYHVVGVLTGRNTLRLPGGASFGLGDKARLADWLDRLTTGGGGPGGGSAAFGLTGKQLVAVHDQLAVPVRQATEGKGSREVVAAISRQLAPAVRLDAEARTVLAEDDPVLDELSGLSGGTALAAVLRPLGLVLVPVPEKRGAGEVSLRVADVRQAPQSWPIGWPTQQKPRDLLPKLYEFFDVEIQDTALSEALAALRQRLGVPLLLDHNALARQRLDPDQILVNYAAGRTYYKRVLDRLLFQARLKAELRVDEAKHPFFWISPVKR